MATQKHHHAGYHNVTKFFIVLLISVLALAAIPAATANAGGAGSIDDQCQAHGFDFGIERFEWDNSYVPEENNPNYDITVSGDAESVSWTASPAVDGVITKGSTDTDVFPGGSSGDVNNANLLNQGGQTPDISHITFCGNYSSDDEPLTCVQALKEGKISHTWDSEQGTATVTNNGPTAYTFSFASYEKYDLDAQIPNNQTLYDNQTVVIQPNESFEFNISVPQTCAYQIDLVCGDVIEHLSHPDSMYNDRKIAWDHPAEEAGACEEETNANIHITKYACPHDTTVTNDNMVDEQGNIEAPKGCYLQEGALFGYSEETNKTDGDTGGPWAESPVHAVTATDENGVALFENLNDFHRYGVLEIDEHNNTLPEEDVLFFECTDDGGKSTDSYEFVYPQADTTKYCVAYNYEPVGDLHVTKYTCPEDTAVTRSENAPDSTGAHTAPEACELTEGVDFGTWHDPANAGTKGPFLGIDQEEGWVFGGTTQADGTTLIQGLSSIGRHGVAELNESGNPISDEEVLGFFCYQDPGKYTDNWDMAFVPKDNATHCVMYNKDTTPPLHVCEEGVNLVANGDFEYPQVTTQKGWDVFANGTAGLEWNVEWVGAQTTYQGEQRPQQANLEFQRSVASWDAFSGEQHVGLDSDWQGPSGNLNGEPAGVRIYQTLETVPGESYTLTFAFSPRPGQPAAYNMMDVEIDGDVVKSLAEDGTGLSTTAWELHNYTFVADSYYTEVAFVYTGEENSLGSLLDAVSVSCNKPVEQPKTGMIHVTKYTCEYGTEIGSANDVNADGSHEAPETCSVAQGVEFGLVEQLDKATGNTSGPHNRGPIATNAFTNASGEVLFSGLNTSHRYGVVELNGSGSPVDAADVLFFSCVDDKGNNVDEYEYAFPEENQTKYCVAYNQREKPLNVCEEGVMHLDVSDSEQSLLSSINLSTGATQTLFTYPEQLRSAVAISSDGVVYSALRDGNNNGDLVILEQNNTLTSVGPTGVSGNIVAMTFAPDGTLYAMNQDTNRLYEISTTTGVATQLATFSAGVQGGDIVVNEYNELFYVKANGAVYQVDLSTFGAQKIGDLPSGSYTSAAYYQGVYYAMDRNDNALYSFEVSTFSYELLGNQGEFGFGDATACPVEPYQPQLTQGSLEVCKAIKVDGEYVSDWSELPLASFEMNISVGENNYTWGAQTGLQLVQLNGLAQGNSLYAECQVVATPEFSNQVKVMYGEELILSEATWEEPLYNEEFSMVLNGAYAYGTSQADGSFYLTEKYPDRKLLLINSFAATSGNESNDGNETIGDGNQTSEGSDNVTSGSPQTFGSRGGDGGLNSWLERFQQEPVLAEEPESGSGSSPGVSVESVDEPEPQQPPATEQPPVDNNGGNLLTGAVVGGGAGAGLIWVLILAVLVGGGVWFATRP